MNTHAAGTRLTALTEAWRTFLRDYPLAEPAVVSLERTLYRISIQVGHHPDALDHLGELLLWAYTLDQVSARWWHAPSGRLHISIDGRASTGVALRVYGGITAPAGRSCSSWVCDKWKHWACNGRESTSPPPPSRSATPCNAGPRNTAAATPTTAASATTGRLRAKRVVVDTSAAARHRARRTAPLMPAGAPSDRNAAWSSMT